MAETLICVLMVAGVLALFVLPVVVLEMIRIGRDRIELERRNGAQAVVIAEYRLREQRELARSERYERECG